MRTCGPVRTLSFCGVHKDPEAWVVVSKLSCRLPIIIALSNLPITWLRLYFYFLPPEHFFLYIISPTYIPHPPTIIQSFRILTILSPGAARDSSAILSARFIRPDQLHNMKDCPNCRGNGTTKCDDCNGKGCQSCKRSGTKKCDVCEGQGAIHTDH